jgi:hypothetical protein
MGNLLTFSQPDSTVNCTSTVPVEEWELRFYKYECRVYEETHRILNEIIKELPNDDNHLTKLRDVTETLNMIMYTNIFEAKTIISKTPAENDNERLENYMEHLKRIKKETLN